MYFEMHALEVLGTMLSFKQVFKKALNSRVGLIYVTCE